MELSGFQGKGRGSLCTFGVQILDFHIFFQKSQRSCTMFDYLPLNYFFYSLLQPFGQKTFIRHDVAICLKPTQTQELFSDFWSFSGVAPFSDAPLSLSLFFGNLEFIFFQNELSICPRPALLSSKHGGSDTRHAFPASKPWSNHTGRDPVTLLFK